MPKLKEQDEKKDITVNIPKYFTAIFDHRPDII